MIERQERCARFFIVAAGFDASAPCPTAGSMTSGANTSVTRSCKLRRTNPARASTMASYSPAASFASRVSTLPRMPRTSRSARTCNNWARLRKLPVPTIASGGNSAKQPLPAHQRVARIFPLRHRGHHQSVDFVGRQVLQAVNGQVDLPVEQGALQLLGEHAGAADVGNRVALGRVAARGDRHQLDGHAQRDQPRLDPLRLPAGQGARARSESQLGHGVPLGEERRATTRLARRSRKGPLSPAQAGRASPALGLGSALRRGPRRHRRAAVSWRLRSRWRRWS